MNIFFLFLYKRIFQLSMMSIDAFFIPNDYISIEVDIEPSNWILLRRGFPPRIIYIYIYTNPPVRAGYDTRSIFKQSLTDLNSGISFS